MKLDEKILMHRKRLGLSQEELAERLNISRQAVSKWEVGISIPEPENIVALAKIFGVTTDALLTDAADDAETPARPENGSAGAKNAFAKGIRRFGWLFGVYLALLGAGGCGLGLLARIMEEKMYVGIAPELTQTILADSPLRIITLIFFVLGAALIVTGVITACVLFRKRKK